MPLNSLSKSVNILLLFFLIFAGLHYAKPVLFPFTMAAIIAMLLLPLSKRLEGKGLKRPLSALVCLFILALIIALIISLLIWQMTDIAKDFSEMQTKLSQLLHQVQQFIHAKLGISEQEQKELIKTSKSSTANGGVTMLMSNMLGIAVDFVLVIVYIFIFLISRSHLKKFILKVVPKDDINRTEKIIEDSTMVSYKYLSGLTMMIVMLWILYGIGFTIAGIKNALFFAVLCGILEVIPFVGNLTGTVLTVLMALTQGGGPEIVLGVVITYFLVQFIQSYIIEPMVVGAEVNINPLFTIVALVVGETVWGIGGLVLAIPLLGMFKIVCDNIEELKPYGYLIGESKNEKKSPWIDKIKGMFKRNSSDV